MPFLQINQIIVRFNAITTTVCLWLHYKQRCQQRQCINKPFAAEPDPSTSYSWMQQTQTSSFQQRYLWYGQHLTCFCFKNLHICIWHNYDIIWCWLKCTQDSKLKDSRKRKNAWKQKQNAKKCRRVLTQYAAIPPIVDNLTCWQTN